MNDNSFLNDLLECYKHSSDYKDSVMREIMLNRKKYEQNLDEMWSIYTRGNLMQVFEYRKGVDRIKSVGLRVLRNKSGQHKIVYK